MTAPSQALKDARLRIELNTDDAQARLDALEEAMDDLGDELDEREDKLTKQEKKSTRLGRTRIEREGRNKPSMDATGPGKFGLRQIPALLSAENLAGAIGGPFGGAAKLVVAAEQRYGAVAEGIVEGMVDQLPLSPMMKVGIKAATAGVNAELRKWINEIDLRMKALQPALERVIEMSKATLVTGGHINAHALEKFARTAYDWEFVNARKEKDIRDKTLKLIATQAPGAIRDLWMQVAEGKFQP